MVIFKTYFELFWHNHRVTSSRKSLCTHQPRRRQNIWLSDCLAVAPVTLDASNSLGYPPPSRHRRPPSSHIFQSRRSGKQVHQGVWELKMRISAYSIRWTLTYDCQHQCETRHSPVKEPRAFPVRVQRPDFIREHSHDYSARGERPEPLSYRLSDRRSTFSHVDCSQLSGGFVPKFYKEKRENRTN